MWDCLREAVTSACGADHFAVFELTKDPASAVAFDPSDDARHYVSIYEQQLFWIPGRLLLDAMECSSRGEAHLMVADTDRAIDVEMRRTLYSTIGERPIICTKHGNTALGMSVLRSIERGQMQSAESANFVELAGDLMSALARHCELTRSRRATARSLASLETIENCPREADILP